MLRAKPCKLCGSGWHTAMGCPLRENKKFLVARKPMNKVGKVAKQTAAAVAKWKRAQKPNHQGYFECYMCHGRITYQMAEHVKSKARNPVLRTDPSNFKHTCDDCNGAKGSKDN